MKADQADAVLARLGEISDLPVATIGEVVAAEPGGRDCGLFDYAGSLPLVRFRHRD